MEKFKKLINSNQPFIICLILSTLLTCIFTIFVYTSTPKNLTEFEILEDASTKINDINSSLSASVTGIYIDTDDSIELLTNNVSDLNIIKTYLSSLIITEDSAREALPLLTKSINDTISLYNTCLLSLTDDTSSPDEYLSEIKELQTTCSAQYDMLNDHNIELDFSYDSISFFDSLYSHLDSISSENKYMKIKESQISDFINHLKLNLNNFSPLLQDLSPAIEKIRNDKRSLDVILDDIKNKESLFSEVKNSTLSTSIPAGYSSYYDDSKFVFDLYSNYINLLKIAVVYENSSSYEDNKDIIDKNYENAFSKLEDVTLNFDSLVQSLNNL